MMPHVHRLAAAGNAAALLLVVVFAVALAKPFDVQRQSTAPPLPTAAATETANRVVLVVIDGLRADVARDPRAMPFLNELAAAGGATTARVETLVPSSVAGITTLATGAVPHPASFLHDFRAPPAPAGGLFEALAARGERSFVAGAALWSDLYGRWGITAYRAEGLADHDEAVLLAGLDALGDESYRLAVFHFGRPDEAGHLHGARTPEYAQAVAWCDDAVRQIAARLGPDAALVVTSDHGLTDDGGHAGPEAEVLDTPLVMRGPGLPTGTVPAVRQRDVPVLIARALGVSLPAPASAQPGFAAAWLIKPPMWLSLAGVAALSALAVSSRLLAGADGRPGAFWMNAALWVCIGLLMLGHPAAAAAVATGALILVAALQRGPITNGTMARPALVLACGGTWAATRLAFERHGVDVPPLVAGGVMLILLGGLLSLGSRPDLGWAALAVPAGASTLALALGGPGPAVAFTGAFGVAAAIGASLRDWPGGTAAGGTIAWTASLAAVAAGQSLSLSTIDVRAAYAAAQNGGGLAAALAVVLLLQALPAAAVVLGTLGGAPRLAPATAGGLFVGLAAFPTGEALVFGSILLSASDLRLCSFGLGGLLRAAASLVFLMCGAAIVLLVAKRDTTSQPPPVT